MNRFGKRLPSLALLLWLLISLVGCQKLFSEFRIDDSAFAPPPITVNPNKGLYTTEWGGQARFTIVLEHEPTADVTIVLSSNNTNEGTVSPSSVTFNKDDWKAPQVITVTGVDDTIADPNKKYKIVTAPAVSEDPSFNGKNAIDLELVNVDNETAGITVVPRSGLVTSEGGAQDTFTVVVNSPPSADVSIDLTSDTPGEGTVSPANLLFTTVNWMAPQLVTVTGMDDDVKDPEHKYKINITSKSDDPNYARVAPISVEVTNDDNESAGVTVDLVTGIDAADPHLLRTGENLDTATFTVVLKAQPKGDVTIPVSSDTPSEGTASPESLKFTVDNWSAPQVVTVTGVDDDGRADGDQPYLIVLGTPVTDDADYAALERTEVPVRNTDDEKPQFTLTLLSGIDPNDRNKLVTSEERTTATFSLAVTSRPAGTVTVSIVSGMPTEAEVSPKLLTFTTDNWRSPQVVSVTGLDDEVQDGSPLFYVTTTVVRTEDPGYALDPPDVQVTNQDNDSAGVTVVLVKGTDPLNSNKLVTEEKGTTATFTVALKSQPTADVTISLSNNTPKEGSLWTSSLTFTSENYRAPQPITVAGVDDKIFDGNQPYTITVGPAKSSDANYDGKFMSQVQVTNLDDDTADFIVNPLSGLSTSEDATSASFTIRLQSQPTADVKIGISSSNPAEGRPNVSSVTFTDANWNANQTVTVTGQDDDGAQDGSPSYKILLAAAESGDPNYNAKDPPDVTLTNIDNDTAGFNVTPTSGLLTSEGGGKATFTIALRSKPVHSASPGSAVSVKFTLTSSKTSEGNVSPASLTFTDVNWRSAQTVTVTGVDDEIADGPQPYLITMGLAQSTDQNYNNHKPSDVSVINNDDDSARLVITPVPSQTPLQTSEKAGKATFSVALNSLPTDDVTFTLTSLDMTEGTVSPATLKFTATNGKTAQVVTVTGVNDDLADGDQQYAVRLSNGVSSDPNYSGKFGVDLPFLNVDDDIANVNVLGASGLHTSELKPGTATFSVVLNSQPTASVSIALSSSNTLEGTVSPAMLTFTSSNWSTAQTVTITGADDQVADGPQSYRVRLANAVSDDPKYSGKFATQVDVQNDDDDQVGYDVSSPSGSQTTEAGGQVTFSVKLKSKPANASTVTLGLSIKNDKEGTVSPSSLVFTTDDWNTAHPVTVTGVDDKKADLNVAYQVEFMADAMYGAPAPSPITLTNVNDDVIGVQVNSTTCATTPGTTATFTINLTSQPTANVTIALSSDAMTAGTVSPDSVTFTPTGTGIWDVPQTVTVTGQTGTAGTMTPYNIITADASAPGETTGYNGYSMIADVMCTNTVP